MNKFENAWCYETVRLRDQSGELFDDRHANQIAILASTNTACRLLTRAHEVSRTNGLDQPRRDVRQTLRIGVLLIWMLSLVTGVSAGLASLGDSTQPVNVLWAVGSLLLLPTLMLLAWLMTFVMRSGSGGWLARGVQMIVGRLLSRGATALAWQAWLRVIGQAKAQRWWLAFLTHSIWFWVMTGALLSLIVAFSLRHYTFVWQTTWLSGDVFVQMAQWIGALPAKLGFVMPTADEIQASGNVAVDQPDIRLAWSNWLVGAVLVFGWLPRALLAMTSWFVLHRRYTSLRLDLEDAYALAVREKLNRLVAKSDVDAPPGPAEQWQSLIGISPDAALTRAAVVILETALSSELHARLPVDAVLLPPVDDQASRELTLKRLSDIKPGRLLVIADARQTPDRGVIRAILSFGAQAVKTSVYLLHTEDPRARRKAWEKRLEDIGLANPFDQPDAQLDWLRGIQ